MLDFDDDTTRVCEKCEERARWSKHKNCKTCIECAGRKAIWAIRARRGGQNKRPRFVRVRMLYQARRSYWRSLGFDNSTSDAYATGPSRAPVPDGAPRFLRPLRQGWDVRECFGSGSGGEAWVPPSYVWFVRTGEVKK